MKSTYDDDNIWSFSRFAAGVSTHNDPGDVELDPASIASDFVATIDLRRKPKIAFDTWQFIIADVELVSFDVQCRQYCASDA